MGMLPRAISERKVSIGAVVVALSVGTPYALKALDAWRASEQRVENLERDLRWLRRDVEAATGKPITRYYYEED